MLQFHFVPSAIFPVVDQALGERLAETPKRISDLTQALGEALRTYGQRIIAGDDAFYNEMAKVRWWHVAES